MRQNRQYTIDSKEAMAQFFNYVINVYDCLLHPDDSFFDMVDTEGRSAFDTETATYLNDVMEECFSYCEQHGLDIYEEAGIVQVREYKRLGLLTKDFGAIVEGD